MLNYVSASSMYRSHVLSAQSDVDDSKEPLDDVELTHRSLLSSAALIKPLPVGCGGEDAAVLAAPSVWLQGDLRLPVLEAHT